MSIRGTLATLISGQVGWEKSVPGREELGAVLGAQGGHAAKQSGSGWKVGAEVRNFGVLFTPTEAGSLGLGTHKCSEYGLAQSANVAPM